MLLRFDPEPQEPEVFLRTPFDENFPRISTDGKWIAYVSDESGRDEIYVRPLARQSYPAWDALLLPAAR